MLPRGIFRGIPLRTRAGALCAVHWASQLQLLVECGLARGRVSVATAILQGELVWAREGFRKSAEVRAT
jgi:hypothetical protein